MGSESGVLQRKYVLVRWRGVCLEPNIAYGMLEASDGQTRIGLDGQVYMLRHGHVSLTTAPRFGAGQFDYWLLDSLTGCSVATRGLGRPVPHRTTSSSVSIAVDDGEIIFGRDTPDARRSWARRGWLATTTYLNAGELVLRAKPPKSLTRLVRRARRAGAVEFSSGVLLCRPPSPGEWPPEPRDRNKRGKQLSVSWDKPVSRGVHDDRDARRLERRYR